MEESEDGEEGEDGARRKRRRDPGPYDGYSFDQDVDTLPQKY